MFKTTKPQIYIAVIILLQSTILSIKEISKDTIDDILLDISLTEDQVREKLNEYHRDLFKTDVQINYEEDVFFVNFVKTTAIRRNNGAKHITTNELAANIDTYLKDHPEVVSNGISQEVIDVVGDIILEYLVNEILVNDSTDEHAKLVINFSNILTTYTKDLEFEDDEDFKALYSLYGSAIREIIKNIRSFINLDILKVLESAMRAIISPLKKKEKVSREDLDVIKENLLIVFNSYIDLYINKGFDILDSNVAMIMSNFFIYAVTNDREDLKEFSAELFNEMFIEITKRRSDEAFQNCWTVKMLFPTLIFTETETIISPEFKLFLTKKYQTEHGLKINQLGNTSTDNEDMALMNLVDYIRETNGPAYNDNSTLLKNKCFITENELTDIRTNFKHVIRGRKLSDLQEIRSVAFRDRGCAEDCDANFDYFNLYYNLILHFKTKKGHSIDKSKLVSQMDAYIEELYKEEYIDEDSLYPIDIKTNYGIYKMMIQYFNNDYEVQLNFKTEDEANEFYKSVKSKNTAVNKFLDCYLKLWSTSASSSIQGPLTDKVVEQLLVSIKFELNIVNECVSWEKQEEELENSTEFRLI